MNATRILLEGAAAAAADERTLPAAVRCLVDWAGCAVGGSTQPAVDAAAAALDTLGQSRDCTLVGRPGRASPFGAALVNGAASHVLDFDDVNVEMIGHPAVVVVPSVLALAEARGADGRTLLGAVTRGYEVSAVLGRLVNPGHYERGWHATATLGCIAAAVGGASILGLDDEAAARAVGLAATQAGGVRAMFGSHGKALHAGRAAAAGVLAATLAEAGAQVPEDVLDGAAGYLAVATDESGSRLDEVVTAARGGAPAILATAFKGHAACGATHCLIDAVASIVREEAIGPDEIAAIDAHVHTLALRAAGIADPATPLESKFSLRHAAALAAHTYPLLPDAFSRETFAPPSVVSLRGRVRVAPDETMRYDQAMPADVTLTTTDGRSFHRRVDTPRGRPGNPMSDEELDTKFRRLAEPVLGDAVAEEALAALRSLPDAGDATSCVRRLAPGAR